MNISQWLLRCYDQVLQLASKEHAERYLYIVSVAEAIFFPIPPDVMLIPMGVAQPNRVFRFAAFCTLASVLGACLGYGIGAFGGQALSVWLTDSSWGAGFERVQALFLAHGIWIMLLAGFTPIPYKLFTLSAGLLGLALPLFLLTSIIGRGARFMLVGALIRLGGPEIGERIRPIVAKAGWVLLLFTVIIYLCWILLR